MTEHKDKKPKEYHFSVDGQEYTTEQSSLTGAEIKNIANVNAAYQLFLEEKGDAPDRQISDGEAVDLTKKGAEHFYAVPPATFG